MKRYIFLLTLPFLALGCFAQDTDIVVAKAFYLLKHQRDTLKKDSPYTENMLLLMGKNSSVFISQDKISQKAEIDRQKAMQAKNWSGSGLPLFKFTNMKKITTQELYQFPLQKKLITKDFLLKNYVYEEAFEDISWALTNETKTFERITCQKATTTFKGRNWIAWFAPDIPFASGPWKLHGLPGLIIEAYDQNREVQYLFSGFENVKNGSDNLSGLKESDDRYTFITVPNGKITKITVDNFNKLKEGMYKNPRGFYSAQLEASGGFVGDSYEMEGFSFERIINPIEKSTVK